MKKHLKGDFILFISIINLPGTWSDPSDKFNMVHHCRCESCKAPDVDQVGDLRWTMSGQRGGHVIGPAVDNDEDKE